MAATTTPPPPEPRHRYCTVHQIWRGYKCLGKLKILRKINLITVQVAVNTKSVNILTCDKQRLFFYTKYSKNNQDDCGARRETQRPADGRRSYQSSYRHTHSMDKMGRNQQFYRFSFHIHYICTMELESANLRYEI